MNHETIMNYEGITFKLPYSCFLNYIDQTDGEHILDRLNRLSRIIINFNLNLLSDNKDYLDFLSSCLINSENLSLGITAPQAFS
jgi:hypothetical protein